MNAKKICAVLLVVATLFAAGCGEAERPENDGQSGCAPADPRNNAPSKTEGVDYSKMAPDDFLWAINRCRGYYRGMCDWAKLERLVRINPALAANAQMDEGGCMSLMYFLAMHGRLDLIKLLADAGADLDQVYKGDETPLMRAAFEGHLDVARYLIGRGCSMGHEIIDATILRDGKKVRALLDADPALFHLGDNAHKGCTLHWAALFGCDDIVQLLLKRGVNAHEKARGDYTALHFAARRGSPEVVDLLLAAGIGVSVPDKYHGTTPLHWAAETGNVAMAKYLIAKGAAVNAKGWYDRTPLHIAAENRNVEFAKLLLDNGADVNAALEDRRETPLHLAAQRGDLEMVRLLVGAGGDVNSTDDRKRNSAHYAATDREILACLIGHGVDYRARDKDGETPLHIAARCGDIATAKLLVEKGAPFKRGDFPDMSPMDCAAERGHLDMVRYLESCGDAIESDSPALYHAARSENVKLVEYLLDRGVDIKTRYGRGTTVLHRAAGFSNCKVVELLLDRGADINAKDDEGHTPLWEAVRWNTEDGKVAELLRARGAE